MLYRKGLEDVRWHIPSLFNNDLAALMFLNIFNMVYGANSNIKGAYGSPMCIWNSGRNAKVQFRDDDFRYFVDEYNRLDVSCYLTFSSFHITEHDLDDLAGNEMLRILNGRDFPNYVIVSSDLLADYIHRNFKNLKLESSVLKPVYEYENYEEGPEYYNGLADRFNQVVIRPENLFNNDFLDYLDELKMDRFVALVNQTCSPYCPRASKHYDMYEDYGRGKSIRGRTFCSNDESKYMESLLVEYPSQISLVRRGFRDFKLQGRNINALDFLHMLGEYVFEPTGEFQMLLNYTKKKMNAT